MLKSASKSPTEMRFQPVTPEQDAAFLNLAKDPEKNRSLLQRMVDAAAKAAGFIESAYHGRTSKFNEFDANKSGTKSNTGAPKSSFFFSKSKEIAESYLVKWQGEWSKTMHEGGNVLKASLNLGKKPLKVSAKGENWRNIEYKGNFYDINELSDKAMKDGKTSLIVSRVRDKGVGDVKNSESTTIVVFDPSQIKSADPVTYDDAGNIIPLSQRFNQASPDIRFQPDPTSPNILNGSNGSRIIKSTSGKYRVYLATGALAGVKDTLESAQKLVQTKSNK